jgi:FKBP-type peptidyl-prolyl cis-trans isomerase FklB
MNRMKQLFVLVGLLGVILTSCNKPNYNAKISTENDSLSYLIGIAYGKQLKGGGEITDLNIDALAKGLNEAFHKDSLKITDEELNMKLNMIFQRLQKRLADKNLKEGQEFLAKNKTKSGVQTLPSGLQYKVIKEGTGPLPDSASLVTTHYTLCHINGDTIESTLKREPAKFQVTQVIPGWTEALLKMRVGSKWQLYVPTELGYGERIGRGSPLKPNEALVFTVELINAEKAPAAAPAEAPGR